MYLLCVLIMGFQELCPSQVAASKCLSQELSVHPDGHQGCMQQLGVGPHVARERYRDLVQVFPVNV